MSHNETQTKRSMIIFVNGQETQVSNGHTAHDLLLDLGFERRPVAVEVNKEVIAISRVPIPKADQSLNRPESIERI